jgi:hypothetical protein
MEHPQTEITLEKAVEGDKKIWVYDTHDEVVTRIEDEPDGLITFRRVQGIGNPGVAFTTKSKNIVNIRDISV